MRAALRDPTSRDKVSKATKARWTDPAARKKMVFEMRAAHADPETRQRKAAAARKLWADPEMREKIITRMRTTSKRRPKAESVQC